jgi:ribosome biogenesis protein Nip4
MAISHSDEWIFHGKVTKMLEDFVKQFSRTPIQNKKINDSFFLVNNRLEDHSIPDKTPFILGCYLGKIKKNTFFPSFNLLDILSDFTKEKIIVNTRGEIDFLYGKHLRKRHIHSIQGSHKKNTLKLVQNRYDENLGYGLFIGISDDRAQVLRHFLDRGVFIKRDKYQK